jgi:transcriptional regulator with XRE-family HTH domain
MVHLSDVDLFVGRRVEHFRLAAGFSLQQLAELLEIPADELLEMERGENRISASMLFAISRALKRPMAAFFSDPQGN